MRATTVTTTTRNRRQLEELARSDRVSSALRTRAHIVLLAADGRLNVEIAAELGVSIANVATWRSRYARFGVAGLQDKPRSGRPRQIDRALIITETLRPPPAEVGYSRWTCRELARYVGVSEATVARVWREYGVCPQDDGGFSFTTQPGLQAKSVRIVGLHAAVATRVAALVLESGATNGRPVLTVEHPGSGMNPRSAADHGEAGDPGDLLRFVNRVARVHPGRHIELVLDQGPGARVLKETGAMAALPQARCRFTLDSSIWLNLVQVWVQMMDRDGVDGATWARRHLDTLRAGRPATWIGPATGMDPGSDDPS